MGSLKNAIKQALAESGVNVEWVGNASRVLETPAQAKYNDLRKVESNYINGVHKARKTHTPVMWNHCIHKFIPAECLGASYPMLAYEECEKVCSEMNVVVISQWQPKTGEVYWHPCTW